MPNTPRTVTFNDHGPSFTDAHLFSFPTVASTKHFHLLMTFSTTLRAALPALFLLFSGRLAAQGYSMQLISHTTVSITTGDLDSDGDVDIVSGGLKNIVLNENMGNSEFVSRTLTTEPTNVRSVTIIDLDEDGHKDIVLSDLNISRVNLLRNNGDNTFEYLILQSNTDGAAGLAVADIDGDGDLDIACAAFTGNRIHWLRNDGGAVFTRVEIATSLSGVSQITAADYDADGDMDLVACLQTAGSVRLFRNDGSEVFTNELLANMTTPRQILNGDVDQDGLMDVLYAGGGGVGWFRNTGTAFTQQVVFTANVAPGVGLADLDANGHLDLLVASAGNTDMFWRGNGPGNAFVTGGGTFDSDFDGASMILPADFNNDGRPDVVCASNSDIRVYINSPGQVFTTQLLNRWMSDVKDACHGDFDNDGDVDMMAIGTLYLDFYENDGTGHLDAKILRQGTVRITVNSGSYLQAADMDDDGDLDLAYTESSGNWLRWIENQGGGSFFRRDIGSLSQPYALDIVDFDGDGDMDALTSTYDNDAVYWFENNGSQVFTSHFLNGEFWEANEVVGVDPDNDGDIDVLVAYAGLSDKVIMHRRESDGTFVSQVVDAAAGGVTSVAAIDVDGDGDLDFLSSTGDDNRVNWYENSGDPLPTYTKRLVAAGVGFATYVAAGDLDGDGDVDVVSAASTDQGTDWFENDGDQNFTSRTLARGITDPWMVGIGDIDGDGTPEIYSTCSGTEAVQLYRTQEPPPIPVGPVPTTCHDPFISQYLHEPGDQARALEIYNPRSVPLDLSGFGLRVYPNGSSYLYYSVLLGGVVPPQGTHVVVDPFSDAPLQALADQLADLYFDGPDAIVLLDNGRPIDIIGKVGEEVDDEWFSGGVGTYFTGLIRKPTVDKGDADGSDAFLPDVEWLSTPVADRSGFGSHTAPCTAVCTPSILITADATEVCPGDEVVFNATTTDAGSGPQYQWTVNGIAAGTNSASYTMVVSATTVVECAVTSSAACAPGAAIGSNTWVVNIVSANPPVVSINGSLLTASPVANATFQWYVNGTSIPGANAQTFTATQAGTYTAISTVDGCLSAPSNGVVYDFSTSVPHLDLTGIRLFPNLAREQVFIESNEVFGMVEVLDVQGRLLMAREVNATRTVLTVTELSSGAYILRARDENGVRTIRFLLE